MRAEPTLRIPRADVLPLRLRELLWEDPPAPLETPYPTLEDRPARIQSRWSALVDRRGDRSHEELSCAGCGADWSTGA